ncbi:MAG: SUMF1/EgtB/PvdO family nonheme iron enzyme [Planctomycetota bacterium]
MSSPTGSPDPDSDPGLSPPIEAADSASGATDELLTRLASHRFEKSRYSLQGEIARGGMGAILKVRDEDLRRTLAMKVILGKADARVEGSTPSVDSRMLGRFLEEAQVTGQLDHPGIAPVHELGLDSDGRVYFTMKLVKGRDLKHIFDLVFEGKEKWNETRALSVVLKVCEAMAYAHSKGVIHRDLKPANVMVGSFGEVYVMDWGLARVLGRKDTHDIRLRPDFTTSLASVKTERREEREESPDSPLVTMDGDVMGTPAYMPPEQAQGEIERLSPRSDVYAIGSMLYHLLARQMPYVKPQARISNRTVLAMVLQGPPAPLATLRKDVPAELAAICEKAMAREPENRYADTLGLAEDLRAYLEHRVVHAYETGAWAEAKKWVERNKPLAASVAAGVLALIVGLIVSLSLERKAEKRRIESEKNAIAASENAAEAKRQEEIARRNLENLLSLSAVVDLPRDLGDLVRRAGELWPADPENLEKYEAWLESARSLLDGRVANEAEGTSSKPGLADLSRKLAEVDSRAVPQSEAEREAERRAHPRFQELTDNRERIEELSAKLKSHESPGSIVGEKASSTQLAMDRGERDRLQVEVAALEREVSLRRNWVFPQREDQILHALLSKLVTDLEAFMDPRTGLASSGASIEHGWGIERRLEFAKAIEERSVSGAEARARWTLAIESIRTPARCPKYDALSLEPQLGLLPIGQDTESGLWEFADLATGEPAERNQDGRIVLKEASGIVFVLIPGGTFLMGAQAEDPSADHFDPNAQTNESPVQPVNLEPFFLSKYEMTQAQWERLTATNPSLYNAGNHAKEWSSTGRLEMTLHPVEQVSWEDCSAVLPRFGMTLPTEAQWEHACRAGTDTIYWSGDETDSLEGVANTSDAYGKSHGNEHYFEWDAWLDDGETVHAQVGSYRANPFGLFDMHGNVWEWCRDRFGLYSQPVLPGDGQRDVAEPISWSQRTRVFRGGSFAGTAVYARSSRRNVDLAGRIGSGIGVRPARMFTVR